jgi:FtsP/CotA-like multicopper oxidase with cupredoxin domain
MLPGCGSDPTQTILNGQSSNLPAGGNNPGPAPGPVPPAFVQLPVQKSAFGILNTTLTVQFSNTTVGPTPVNVRTYNGAIGGPTLRVRPGDTLRVNVVNNLPANPDPMPPANSNTPHQFNTTNLHTHGLHVSPSGNSDNIFVEIPPLGGSFQYEYQIPANHPPGTMWYHPHKHGSSSVQLFSGMAGALIIEGGIDGIPEIAAARDLVYLINELNINAAGQVPDFVGNSFPLNARRFVVNGQERPTLQAFSGEVIRLRVINGSVRSTVPFAIQGHTLHIISLDGLALPAVRQAASISLPPAGRADVMIRCGAPGDYNVQKLLDNSVGNPDPQQNIGLLTVLNTTVTMDLPTNLLPQPHANIPAAEVNQPVRMISFDQTSVDMQPAGFQNFAINQIHFNAMVVNQTVQLGAVEEWLLTNTSPNGHPFHIHINPFEVIEVNGVALPQSEWHDTFNVPAMGSIRIRHRFEDFTGLFVFHCHILVHEDLGMMQTVNVV